MKYIYLLVAIGALIALIILYFQLIVSVNMQVPFFDKYIPINLFTLYLISLAFISGLFFTLGIKGLLSSANKIDDDFDL